MPRVLKFTLILSAAILALSPLPRTTVEQLYSRGIYPMLQPRLTSLSNGAPFALFDAVVVVIVIAMIGLWTARLRALRGRSGKSAWLAALAIDTAAIASVLYLWFLAVWGLNYQ